MFQIYWAPYSLCCMTKRNIFSAQSRTDESTRRGRESSFEFLNRSARPEIERVRSLISDALNYYPDEEFEELVSRITSGDEQAFRSATFELLLHEALRRLGFNLYPHPSLPNEAKTKPDFLVEDPTGGSFYLEAVLTSSRDGRNRAAEAMKKIVINALSQKPHKSFRVNIRSKGEPLTQPSSRDLIRRTHAWLDLLDPDEIASLLANGRSDLLPTFVWRHESWSLTLRPHPIPPNRRGMSSTLLGIHHGEASRSNGWTPLRNAIKEKGTNYGIVTKPLIVAVNADAFHLDRIDEVQALFGQEKYVYDSRNPDSAGETDRIPNGAWAGPKGPQLRRVSAAWFFNDLTPYSVAARRSTLYINPWATYSPPESIMRFPHAKAIDNKIEYFDGIDFRNIFSLTAGWPM